MMFWKRLQLLLPWRRRAAERDMQEELRSIAAMAEPRELGNLTRVAQDARAEWTWRWLDETSRDLRYAWRTLRKSPAFTVTAVFSLALGIGAASSIFALVDAVLLRALPVRDPHELVLLAERFDGQETLSWSTDQLRLLRQNGALTGICAFRPRANFTVAKSDGAELVPGQIVSGNCFDMLGLGAAVGRLLNEDDERAGDSRPVAVISHQFWQRTFAGDPNVVGRTLDLRGQAVTIVGVTPRAFYGFEPGRTVDITVPLQPWAIDSRMKPNIRWMRLMGRLRPEVSFDRAAAELDVRWQAIRPPAKPGAPAVRFALLSGTQGLNDLRTEFSLPLRLLLAAVGLLLLVGCANLASLLLARSRGREQELTVRLALGAKRIRILRQLLTESIVLSVLGGAAGLVLARWGSDTIVAILSRGRTPILLDLSLDTRLVAFALGLCLLTSLAFGLWPALAATRRDLQSRLRAATRTVVSSHRRRARVLMTAQTTLAVVLPGRPPCRARWRPVRRRRRRARRARPSAPPAVPCGGSRELDVGRAFESTARGVEELDLERARSGRPEREGEERILGHALRGVEGQDGLAEVGHDHLVDVVVVLLNDPALRVALDPLHRMEHEHAHLDDIAGLDGRRQAEADLVAIGHR
jgi:hypothetical protein